MSFVDAAEATTPATLPPLKTADELSRRPWMNRSGLCALGCAAGLFAVVGERRCVQILGWGEDAMDAALFLDVAGAALGWGLFAAWRKRHFPNPFHFAFLVLLVVIGMGAGERLIPARRPPAAGVRPAP